jgi:hypothetical protein
MPSIAAEDPEHWLARAAEACAIAAGMNNPEPKLMMLDIVESYRRLAKWSEQRAKARLRTDRAAGLARLRLR